MRRLPKLNRLFLIAIPFLYLGLGSARCGAIPGTHSLFPSAGFIDSGFIIGDFDGDGYLDDIVVVRVDRISRSRAIYNVSIHMGSGVTQDVSFIGPEGPFEILQRDVTGNGTPDLVLAAAWLGHPLAVLVNLDNGMGTFRVADPVAYAAANEVPSAATWVLQTMSQLGGVVLFAKRIVPRENEGRSRIPLPRPLLASRLVTETSDASRLLLFSLSSRAPPSFRIES